MFKPDPIWGQLGYILKYVAYRQAVFGDHLERGFDAENPSPSRDK
jgi:hypothetical protein